MNKDLQIYFSDDVPREDRDRYVEALIDLENNMTDEAKLAHEREVERMIAEIDALKAQSASESDTGEH